ncbi:MAG: hypothetical protein D6734_03520 [Candidatus Schekmanbacteria bacterium]|nr:MAG: hypothetical protein D6734_03520 [Candidatus Schekmanbacteria bacterium]
MKKRISIYADEGASHSFIWLIKFFKKHKLYSVNFVSSQNIKEGCLSKCDVLIISGGDSFAIAESLGIEGAKSIENFIKNGGTYIGVCAGAYLMLRSSKKPLNYFNFTSAKIRNLASSLPPAKTMEYKYSVTYGCRYIYHPVRGEIIMKVVSEGLEEILLSAPIYGGPFIKDDDTLNQLAVFWDFTDKTLFLIDRETAESICRNSMLAGEKKYEKGKIFLLSTHMEHPDYEFANRFFLGIILDDEFKAKEISNISQKLEARKMKRGKIENKKYYEFRKNIRNMRQLSIGIENRETYWKIGKKIWETEKIRIFTESLYELDNEYGHNLSSYLSNEDTIELKTKSYETYLLLQKISKSLSSNSPSQIFAESFFTNARNLLSRYASLCFSYSDRMKK